MRSVTEYFSSICGGPPESSLNNLIWLNPLALILEALPNPPRISSGHKRHALTSRQLQPDICSENSGGNLLAK